MVDRASYVYVRTEIREAINRAIRGNGNPSPRHVNPTVQLYLKRKKSGAIRNE